eukprot:287860-Pelagomonas_calceolata.AAC.3
MELITCPGHSCQPAALIASHLAGCSMVVAPPDADQQEPLLKESSGESFRGTSEVLKRGDGGAHSSDRTECQLTAAYSLNERECAHLYPFLPLLQSLRAHLPTLRNSSAYARLQAEVEKWLAVAVDIEQHSRAWVEPFASSKEYSDEDAGSLAAATARDRKSISGHVHSASQSRRNETTGGHGGPDRVHVHNATPSFPANAQNVCKLRLPPCHTLFVRVQGRAASQAALTAQLHSLEAALGESNRFAAAAQQGSTAKCIAGTPSLSIADIALLAAVQPLLSYVMGAEARAPFPRTVQWVLEDAGQHASVAKVMGRGCGPAYASVAKIVGGSRVLWCASAELKGWMVRCLFQWRAVLGACLEAHAGSGLIEGDEPDM